MDGHTTMMNLSKPIGVDLTENRKAASKLGAMINLPGSDEAAKVFYNTSSLQLKNSLSHSIRTKSYGHQNKVRLTKRGVAPENPMKEIQSKLKQETIRETVLIKKPTKMDLKTALRKHRDQMGCFYQRDDIKKITED